MGRWKKGAPWIRGAALPLRPLPFQIYNSPLEEEFNHFEDWLNVFPLYRGQGGQAGDGEEGSGHLVGKFKVYLGGEWGITRDW